jgi:hypothetical protein
LAFTLYSRAGCGLCEEMHSALAALAEASGIAVEIVDIDADPALRSRFGHKIPVLHLDGALVCHGHLNTGEVHKALACRRRPV